jgi:DNA-binding transcriptional LysR family regulator
LDVDTGLLRCFVAVAEERNFTRAAHRLFESQPTVSRRVRRLEELLRTDLFARGDGVVRLTQAGTALLPAARRVAAEWCAAVDEVRRAAEDTTRTLRVGYAVTGAGALMAAVQSAFTARHAGVVVAPRRLAWGAETRALRDAVVDIAYVWLPADTTGCHAEVVTRQPRVIGLPVGHPLTSRTELCTDDLSGIPACAVHTSPGGGVRWWAAGEHPVGEPAGIDELLDCVAAGHALCGVPESVPARHARPTVVWRPLRDGAALRVALAWRSDQRSPLVPAFAGVVRALARTAVPADGSSPGGSPVRGGPGEARREADRLPCVDVPAHQVEVGTDLRDGIGAQR